MNAPQVNEQTIQQAADYLCAVAAGLLPQPELLEVRAEDGSHGAIYLTLVLPPSSRGFLIGRQGWLYDSLCNIMRAYSGLRKTRFIPKIFDGSTKEVNVNETKSQSPDA